MSFDRYLFIGLGGSGGSTLGHLKEALSGWLKEQDHQSGIPSGWQFLHIDTPTNADTSPKLPDDEYLGLIQAGVQYGNVQQMLDGDHNLHNEIQTWRVDPAALPVPLSMGAGQFRAIGQTVSIAYAQQIRSRIEQSIGRLSKGQSKAEIGEVYQKATGEKPGTQPPLRIVVISSLAGGTGAGLLQTVCDIVRAMGTEASEQIFGVLYTPEVFQSLGSASTGGVQPNSLAAISELLNGYWWNGATTIDAGGVVTEPKESAIMVKAGLPQALPASGPAYPFLVGRVGQGGVDHGTPQDLFSMVGRSILSWVTDETVQRDFIAYTIANWQSSSENHLMGSGVLVNEGANAEKGFPSFSALGFSRLSVGTDHFETYAARRLVRDALDLSAKFHLTSDMAQVFAQKLDTEDPDALADAIADEHLMGFIKHCQLSELGVEENEIQDALRPPRLDVIVEEFRQNATALAGLTDGSSRKAEDWRQLIHEGITNHQPNFVNKYSAALEETTAEWVEIAQGNLEVAVEVMVAHYGLKVTSAMCTKAAAYLRTEVTEDLRNVDLAHNSAWAADWQTHADAKLEGTWGKKIESTDPRLQESMRIAIHHSSMAGNALLADRAAALSAEFADRALVPMATALDDALYRSERDLEQAGEWPAWTAAEPPPAFLPPPSEFPLIQPKSYNKLFTEMLTQSMSEDKAGAVRDEIRRIVISGDFLRRQHSDEDGIKQADQLLCVAVQNDWWPSPSASHQMLKTSSDLVPRVNVDIERLEERARAWLRRSGSVFGNFLGISLRSYLGAVGLLDSGKIPESEYDRRRTRFFTQLAAAMDAAQPLINLDQGLMGLVHPNNKGVPSRIFSQIPFASHPITDEVESRLLASGVHDGNVAKLLTADDSIKHIDITTALAAPHSILVIQSLLEPIAESWAQYASGGHRQTFWSRRRARTIAEFVPAPQALIHCMVRGWFTGVLLGLIDRGDGTKAVRIARPDDSPAEFPFPFLSDGAGFHDRLPQVLESLGLAYVKVSQENTLRALAPYCALRDLGRSEPGASLFAYHQLHPMLAGWIESGEVPGAVATPVLDPGLNRTERLDHLADLLNQSLSSYTTDIDGERRKWAINASALSGPPLWTGIWPMIQRELGLLHETVKTEIAQGGSSKSQI